MNLRICYPCAFASDTHFLCPICGQPTVAAEDAAPQSDDVIAIIVDREAEDKASGQ